MADVDIALSMLAASIRGEMQYRANFLVMVVMGLVFQLTGLVFIWVILLRFDSIAGWKLPEIAFLYGLRLLVHSLRGVTFGNVGTLIWYIRLGDFDRLLVRPVPPLLHLLAMRIPVGDIGNLIGGVGVFAVAATSADVNTSAPALAYLALAIAGGCLVSAALQLGCASLTFHLMNTNALYALVNDINNTFANYPLTIFNSTVQFVLTFVLPLAFIAYFPSTVLLGRTDEISVSPLFAYLAPLAGVVAFGLALLVWRHGLSSYQSAGH